MGTLGIIGITIAICLFLGLSLWHLIKSSDKFWQAAREAEEKIKKADNAWDAIKILQELQKKAWHRYHGDRIRELHSYIKGKFNLE